MVAATSASAPVIRRRTFIVAIAASPLGGPLIARARQAGTIHRLGILGNVPPSAVNFDPVGSGLAASFARPGGNITGLSLIAPELVGKQLERRRSG